MPRNQGFRGDGKGEYVILYGKEIQGLKLG